MSSFLEICQDAARESGTFSSDTPISTAQSQTGRQLRLVNWVNSAYELIQTARSDWQWLRAEFSGQTVATQRRYTPAEMGISTRFAEWFLRYKTAPNSFTSYLTADGQSDERFIDYMPWDEFYNTFLVGNSAETTGFPVAISIDPNDKLVIYPLPDAVYTIKGHYQKGPQVLSADADVPEMPSRFHKVITYRALILLAEFDEDTVHLPMWDFEYTKIMSQLMKAERERITKGGPLA